MSIDTDLSTAVPKAVSFMAPTPKDSVFSRGMTGYTTVNLTTREAILSVQGDWQALEHASQGSAVFQAFDLCLPWLEAYVFNEEPTYRARILAFYDEAGAMIALAPFAERIAGFVTMVEWVGEPLVQYGDILMDPACDPLALRKALSDALDEWPVHGLHLRSVRADSRIRRVLDLDHTQVGDARDAAIADLTAFDDPEGYFATFSKRSQKTRRKKRRALGERGTLTFEAVKAGREAEKLCGLALEWKVAWLAERGLSSRAFMDPRALATLKAVAARKSEDNPFHLFVQKLDGSPIAIEMGFVGPLGNAAFMGTYDPEFEASSPGKVQMESAIIHGFDEGWPAYDMLAPMSDYKQSWSNRTVGVADYMLPSSLVGVAYRNGFLRYLRPAIKAVWNALPPSIRMRVLRKGGGLASQ